MLIKNLFEKEIQGLTIVDLEMFFSKEQTENDKLEFKSGTEINPPAGRPQPKESDILKKILTTICGFLNSEGGVLIWGAPEGQILASGSSEKYYKGSLTPVKTILEKDQFINKISDLINPTPNKIKFASLAINQGFIYVLEVEKSDYSPHQINGTYYLRLDAQTRPAPHQYVEALMKKSRVAKLESYFDFREAKRVGDFACLIFSIKVKNTTKFVNERAVRLSLKSFAYIMELHDEFKGGNEPTDKTVDIADILYPGLPVEKKFLLVTTMNLGYGRRRIPIYSLLTGETSPATSSIFQLEFHFTDDFKVSMSILSKSENDLLQDMESNDYKELAEIQIMHDNILYENAGAFESIRKWKSE